MHDALDLRTAPRCRAATIAVAHALRPGARRLFLREALDDWEAARDRALAPA